MRRALLFTLGSLVAILALAASASAYVTAHGAGSAAAAVGSLHAPATPTGSPNGVGAVDVSWHESTLSNGTTKADHYYVSRYSGATLDGYACGTSPTGTTIPAANADSGGNFTCTDSGLTLAGPYTYTVTAMYKHWTAQSAKSSAVTVALFGPLDHFVVAPASTTPNAGATDNLTITAKDSGGRTVTNYTGSHSVTFSGASSIGTNNPKVTNSSGSGIAFGSSTSLSFTNGVSSVSSGNNGVMTLYKAETASIVVSDGTHTNGTGVSVTVSPVSANKLAFVQQPTDTTAGVTMSPSVTVAIQDQYGNQTTGTANVTVSPSSQTLLGTKTQAAVNGLATFDDLSMQKAGSGYTLSASSSGLTGKTSSSFSIGAASPNKLVFTTQPGNAAWGAAITPAPAVTVEDAFNNIVPSSSASVTVAIGTNPGSGTLSGTATKSASSGVATFAGLSIDKVGTGYTLSASSTGLTSATSSTFNITAGAAAKLVFSQQPSGGAGSVSFATQPKVTVEDSAGNTVTTDNGAVTLAIGTNPNFGALSCGNNTVNASSGVATFSACKIDSAANGYTLTASRTGLTGATSDPFNITGLSPTGLTILNGTGTVGKADSGDVITIPFNQAVKLSSVCSTWSSGTVTGVTVTMAKGNGGNTNDLSVTGGTVGSNSCVGGVNIGSFKASTGAYNPASGSVSWASSTVTWDAGTNSLILTLSGAGAPSGSVGSNNTYTYTPDPSIQSNTGSIGVTGKQAVTAINF